MSTLAPPPTNYRSQRARSFANHFAQNGYDALETKKRRRNVAATTQSEDNLLDQSKRRKLAASARDIGRNFSVAAWMIRKHLDFVTQFDFQMGTPDPRFNRDVEELMERTTRPNAVDVTGRHNWAKLLRLAEARRVVDGDFGLLKIRDGRVQGIEGDRVRNPTGRDATDVAPPRRWVHGHLINKAGRTLQIALHNRVRGGQSFAFDRAVPMRNMFWHGFYERYDQVRGISPITSALNPLRDVYENFDYALAKAKVAQLFAMAIFRDSLDQLETQTATEDDDDDGEDEAKYQVDFGKGPIKLELDPGDKAEFLESKHPAAEFQNFTELVTGVALKALDIPYNFYDEAHTNFFGSRAAWILYDRSCVAKRADVVELLRQFTVWRMQIWIRDGLLTLPSGQTIGDLLWDWVPVGVPWWNPLQEIGAELKSIAGGLDNPQAICRRHGTRFERNVDKIAEAKAYAQGKGVDLSYAMTKQETTGNAK